MTRAKHKAPMGRIRPAWLRQIMALAGLVVIGIPALLCAVLLMLVGALLVACDAATTYCVKWLGEFRDAFNLELRERRAAKQDAEGGAA